MNKKEYTAKEAAIELLNKVKAKAQGHLAKSQKEGGDLTKANAEELKIPEQKTPKANEKVIVEPQAEGVKKSEKKLKKFMKSRHEKMEKAAKSKHDRCVEQVEEKSPDVKNPHAVCISAGVMPEKWGK